MKTRSREDRVWAALKWMSLAALMLVVAAMVALPVATMKLVAPSRVTATKAAAPIPENTPAAEAAVPLVDNPPATEAAAPVSVALDPPLVLRDPPLIDLHCDTLLQLYWRYWDVWPFEGDTSTGRYLKVSRRHIHRSGLGAQFFATYIPNGYGYDYAVNSIRVFYDLIAAFPELAFAGNYADLERNLAAGRTSAFLSMEGGEGLGDRIENVDYFYSLGLRSIGLTWNRNNLLADAERPKKKLHGGLSEFGRRVVKRMNELGMIIDVSHLSREGIAQVIALSTDPVMASHSCAYEVRNHWRNLQDDDIRAICGGGGIIGINFYRAYLTDQRPAHAVHIIDHVDHIAKIGGIECVALGSDFDGGIKAPIDFKNIGEIGSLEHALRERGYSQDQIDLIFGRNVVRLIKRVMK